MSIKIPNNYIYGDVEFHPLNNNKVKNVSNNSYVAKVSEGSLLKSFTVTAFEPKDSDVLKPDLSYYNDMTANTFKNPNAITSYNGKELANVDTFPVINSRDGSTATIQIRWMFVKENFESPQSGDNKIEITSNSSSYFGVSSNTTTKLSELQSKSVDRKSFVYDEYFSNSVDSLFLDTDQGVQSGGFYKAILNKFYPTANFVEIVSMANGVPSVVLSQTDIVDNNAYIAQTTSGYEAIIAIPVSILVTDDSSKNVYMALITNSATFSINARSVDISSDNFSIGEESKYETSVDSGPLSTFETSKQLSESVLNTWKNGKATITLDCIYGKYTNSETGLVASSSESTGVVTKTKTQNIFTLKETKNSDNVYSREFTLKENYTSVLTSTEIYNIRVECEGISILFDFQGTPKTVKKTAIKEDGTSVSISVSWNAPSSSLNTIGVKSSDLSGKPAIVTAVGRTVGSYSYTVELPKPATSNVTFSLISNNVMGVTSAVDVTIPAGQNKATVKTFFPNAKVVNIDPIYDETYVYDPSAIYTGYELDGIKNGFLSVGDIIIPMKSETEPVMRYDSGQPVEFEISSCEYKYKSFAYQHIEAVEYIDIDKRFMNISVDEFVSLKIERTDSTNRNGYLGELKFDSKIYAGDTLSITVSANEVGYTTQLIVNGQMYVDKATIVVSENLTITARGQKVQTYTLNTGKATVTRISTQVGAMLGTVTNSDSIYSGDELKVEYSGDIRNYSIVMGNTEVYSGEDVTDISHSVVISGNVVVSITNKVWDWVDYSGGIVTFKAPTRPSNWAGEYAYSEIVEFDQSGLIANKSNNKIWHIKPYVYNSSTGTSIGLDEIIVYGSDFTDFTDNYDTPYGEEGFVGSGGIIACKKSNSTVTAINLLADPFSVYKGYLRFDVSQNNKVDFRNIAFSNSNGTFECYVSRIDFSVSQYEYR